MHDGTLITQAEAAQILGRSVSTVSRCLRNGKLHYVDEQRRLLLREGLEDRFRALTRPRVARSCVKHRIEGVISQLSTQLTDEQIEAMTDAFQRKGLL